jgi:4-amino-4-deoxy-L-arabinose transferase-like glycosyltransferase
MLWTANQNPCRSTLAVPSSLTPDAAPRTARLFLAGLAVYFAAHTAVRSLLGGGLEVDEAEMLVLAQGWHLGYGPQLPLYNWLQVAAFGLFGPTAFALAALKNVVLFAAMAFLFTGLRRVVPMGMAIAGTLSFALLPNIVWEFQRASTHSIALLATLTATIAVVLLLVDPARRSGMGAALALGVALGLGGLAKFNYWLVPISLALAVLTDPALRGRVRLAQVLVALGVAAAIVALPYAWIWNNKVVALGSTDKLYEPGSSLIGGVFMFAEGFVLGLLPVIVAVLAFRAPKGVAVPWPAVLLMRAGSVAAVLMLAGIVAGGVTAVQARWLVPVYALLAPGLMIWAVRGAGPIGVRRLLVAAGLIGLLTLAGMADMRLNGKRTGNIDWAPLAQDVGPLATDPVPVLTDYHVGGNLIYLLPHLKVIAPPGRGPMDAPPRALLVWRGDAMPDPAMALAERGMRAAGGIAVLDQGQRDVEYRTTPDIAFRVGWALIATDAP